LSVQEVSDSIAWRRFCNISIDGKVPHSTTLIKLTQKYGEEIISELNRALVQKAPKRFRSTKKVRSIVKNH